MGSKTSKSMKLSEEKFSICISGYARKYHHHSIPQEIVSIIASYGVYNFIDYDGKFVQNNVGKGGMRILKKSDLTVICHDKGRGASAKMDVELPKIGSASNAVYVWSVKFIDNYSSMDGSDIYYSSAAFIGVVTKDCQEFDAMITAVSGYYGHLHPVIQNATGITADGNVYIDSQKDDEIENGKKFGYGDIIKVMYYVGDGVLVFADDTDKEFCRIPLKVNQSYFPVVSHINNWNNMDVITFDMSYQRETMWEDYHVVFLDA